MSSLLDAPDLLHGLRRTPYLESAAALSTVVAADLATMTPDDETVRRARVEQAVSSLRLDGSTLALERAIAMAEEAAREVEPQRPGTSSRGTWLEAMRTNLRDGDGETITGDEDDEDVQRLELHGVLRGLASDDLTDALAGADPWSALAQLHARVTDGLLAPDTVGALRQTVQAVHDASVGRIIFFGTDPEVLADRVRALASAWAATTPADPVDMVGRAAAVQHHLIRVHPFEAANGRLARVVARLLLRRDGLDPHGLAGHEWATALDAVGHYDEVARDDKRADLTVGTERFAEALAIGLVRAADAAGVDVAIDDAELLAWWDERPDAVTVADVRDGLGLPLTDAWPVLLRAAGRGAARPVAGSQGLRWTRTR